MSKTFIDTNILVYTNDHHSALKKEKCRRIIQDLVSRQAAVISTQVLQEFYVAVTGTLHIAPASAKSIVRSFSNMEVVTIDLDIIHEAIDINAQQHLSFWDSLIVAAAESALCDTLYSEDLASGTSIRNVQIINPLL